MIGAGGIDLGHQLGLQFGGVGGQIAAGMGGDGGQQGGGDARGAQKTCHP